MDPVVIFGAGPQASLLYAFFTDDSPYRVAAFTVDREFITSERLFDLPVVPFDQIERLFPPSTHKMSLPISSRHRNRLRMERYAQARAKGYAFASYIASSATVWPGARLGDNCVVCPNCQIDPFAAIGNNVFVGSGSLVGHHCTIKDHCFIGPHAVLLGGAVVEEGCLIGANATIREGGVTIARGTLVGAGVTIASDTREFEVYVNRSPEPARKRGGAAPVSTREDGPSTTDRAKRSRGSR